MASSLVITNLIEYIANLEKNAPPDLKIQSEDDLNKYPPEKVKKTLLLTKARLPKSLSKYYHQRKTYFSWYDDPKVGPPWLDKEGWYSVTPENIARNTAKHIRDRIKEHDLLRNHEGKPPVVIDMFCGVGGNTIQLAKRLPLVVAFDISEDRLICCMHNLRQLGLLNRVVPILGNSLDALDWLNQSFNVIGVYLSPPWGGVQAMGHPRYSLRDDIKIQSKSRVYNGLELLELLFHRLTRNIILFIPRHTSLDELYGLQLSPASNQVTVQNDMFGNKKKTMTLYFGLYNT